MNQAFAAVIDRCALVYLDDILIMSKSIQEHLSHLREIFSLLRKHKYFAKLSKCEFMKESLPFLGHIISKDGVAVDPSKVTAIKDWPVPTNLTALQSFLGMANYPEKQTDALCVSLPANNKPRPQGPAMSAVDNCKCAVPVSESKPEKTAVLAASFAGFCCEAADPCLSHVVSCKTALCCPMLPSQVILGVAGQDNKGALIDYVDQTLTLRTAQANPKAFVTAKQAARWLRKGGSAMVAMVSLEDLTLPADVSPVHRQHLQALLDEYSDVFEPITGLPPERAVGHSIPLQPDAKPPARPSYRMSKPEHDELRRQITDLLAKGLIEPSSSPFAAPVLFVQKKSGELRMCIDYRQLNKITIRDQYPLPRIDDLFDQLAGKTVFSSLDLQAGYHQIRIPAEDVPKTAFRTPEGHYQFKVLCFGLTNAPATFQRVMNEAFAEVINDCALVYLDDILVMSENTEQHLVHLRRVFDLLRKNKFYAKLSKCEFMKRTLMFLGHIISAQGISVDPCKVTAISNWPVPTSLKTLQSFLGAANYVRKFVHNFSTIAAPLTNLTGPKKDSFPWKAWPQAELDAFNALKQAISNVPMLKLPDHSKPFQVHCDASLEGIGAVLMQDGYPLAYYSRKLIPAEVNYTTGEQELLALMHVDALWTYDICTDASLDICTDADNVDICTDASLDICTAADLNDIFTDASLDICTAVDTVDICTAKHPSTSAQLSTQSTSAQMHPSTSAQPPT
ncbi:hypothetical protein QJQ45_003422 [Haematococcus lacustris]|nr:hypothetical protein QJQ45_003422 [Haematococcus lacustris]